LEDFKVAVDIAWNRRAIFSDANTAEAMELQETATPRERRPRMRHMVARRGRSGTALVHPSYGTTASSGLVGRAPSTPETLLQSTHGTTAYSGFVGRSPATPEKRIPIKQMENPLC